jgi:hypothetical protein
MNEHVKILTDSAIVINRIVQLLEEQGIPTIVKDQAESARLAGYGTFLNDAELYVKKADFKRAEIIIQSFFQNSDQ